MKEAKFKVGDEVICTSITGGGIMNAYTQRAGVGVGDKSTVTEVRESGNIKTNKSRNLILSRHHFEVVPDIVCVILRRPSNWKTVAKALSDAGIRYAGGQKPKDLNPYSCGSRLLHIKLNDKRCYYATETGKWSMKPAQIVKKHTDEVIGREPDGTKVAFINTKPSVKQAINELKLYI